MGDFTCFVLTFCILLIFNLDEIILIGLGTFRGHSIQSCARIAQSSQSLNRITNIHCLIDSLNRPRDCKDKTLYITQQMAWIVPWVKFFNIFLWMSEVVHIFFKNLQIALMLIHKHGERTETHRERARQMCNSLTLLSQLTLFSVLLHCKASRVSWLAFRMASWISSSHSAADGSSVSCRDMEKNVFKNSSTKANTH